MLIVLSPAKTLDFETPPTTRTHTMSGWLGESERLVERMREFDPPALAELMSTDADLLQASWEAECQFEPSARPVWADWAGRILAKQAHLDDAVRGVLQAIRGDDEQKFSSPGGFSGQQAATGSSGKIPAVATCCADSEASNCSVKNQAETQIATRQVA